MRTELRISLIAIVLCTLVLGLAYPLGLTGISQAVISGPANGSLVHHNGHVVGSELIGQDFKNLPRYFQSRPSQTDYSANATAFSNAGPNSADLRDRLEASAAAYLKRERPFDLTLTKTQVPGDAVFTTASGVDPQISVADADIQAHRVAAVRHLSLARVDALVHEHTDGRALGIFGDPAVNVLTLNIALDQEATR